MPAAIALIVADSRYWRFGQPAQLDDRLGEATVFEHTLRRAARVSRVEQIVLVHPADQPPPALPPNLPAGKPIVTFAAPSHLYSPLDQRWVAARKWALTAWRGGLGGATVYDELLPAAVLAAAVEAHNTQAALLLRADWCLFDPAYADALIALHLEHPEAYKITFTQAPPGLSGIVTSLAVLKQFAQHQAGFGQALGYNPRAPHPDPIGRDVNHPIPALVRDTNRRFIYDTPRSRALLTALAQQLGPRLDEADALTLAQACRDLEADDPAWHLQWLPQQVTLELTPRRPVDGPITPQHYVTFDRPDMDTDLALRIIDQLGQAELGGDIALLLGGLGDALLHPDWDRIILSAREAGVMGLGVETDLLCSRDAIDRLLELPLDVLSIRLNADTADTYRQVMGPDAFGQLAEHLQYLVSRQRQKEDGLPWIVPRLIKTSQTLKDMESFFDRWVMAVGHAVIEPSRAGCGLMPQLSPVPMAPPRRRPCRQLAQRMTILSDGQVALCDQDWLAQAPLGDAHTQPLIDIWRRVRQPLESHLAGRFDEPALCAACSEWHRP